MKIKGRLLNYDKLVNGFYFSKDSKIDIPEKVPLVVEFSFADPTKVIGMCHVIRTDTGLDIEADIIGDYTIEKNMGGLGGYYNGCKFEDKKVISAHLKSCSITQAPADKDCRITEVEE